MINGGVLYILAPEWKIELSADQIAPGGPFVPNEAASAATLPLYTVAALPIYSAAALCRFAPPPPLYSATTLPLYFAAAAVPLLSAAAAVPLCSTAAVPLSPALICGDERKP
ncbi:Os04g0422401 [Oryza sativa Japonica Group]|uniref:Os04g0422401 protein n=1 Tax=Oryza sativa subsp. japonica TaxID=39947 RepID=A0A0P0WAI3_ORYSJ|nr:Os04g0422401 [Oryza sativa Japonica Group]